MNHLDILWQKFIMSGKIEDYHNYCIVKEEKRLGNEKRTNELRRTGDKSNGYR